MLAGDQPIPGYKLVEFLGEGAYGVVWKATAPGGFDCALKFISLDSNSGLKEFRAINMMKRVRHANLVPISAVWLKDPDGNILGDTGSDSTNIRMGGTKTLIIAMGLGDKTLGNRLEECRNTGGIPIKELLEYMRDSAKGIDYLNTKRHDLGDGKTAIIHCDIKPANLLIVGGSVQVCDYGVAKAVTKDPRKTQAGGTPAYAPAELLNNAPCAQTDQYSLAITYFELRTGKLPFDENRTILAHITGSLDLTALPADEREVIKRATSLQPSKRYPSCQEMVEELLVASGISFSFGPSGVISNAALNRRTDSHPNVLMPLSSPAIRLTDKLQGGIEIVPDHKLIKLIGQGGYGQVWEAENGGKSFALKVIRDLSGRGRNEFEIFKQIRNFKHPHLIEFLGYWLLAADGTRVQPDDLGKPGIPEPTVVVIKTILAEMNLMHKLRDYQQRGWVGIPPNELIEYAKQAADALDYLNREHDIQHRDIKPENLLLSQGKVLVSDFGLAKLVALDGQASVSSSSGMTLDYAAPEVLENRTVYPQTDQYSLAVTYYMLRTSRLPFRSNLSVSDAIKARTNGQLDLTGVSDEEQVVLKTALNPVPSLRFESCKHFAAKMVRAVSQKGTLPPLDREQSNTELLIEPDEGYELPPAYSPPPLVARGGNYDGTMTFPAPVTAPPKPKSQPRIRETEPVSQSPTKPETVVPLTPAPPSAQKVHPNDGFRSTEPDWKTGKANPKPPTQIDRPSSGFITDEDMGRVRKPKAKKTGALVGGIVAVFLLVGLAGAGVYVVKPEIFTGSTKKEPDQFADNGDPDKTSPKKDLDPIVDPDTTPPKKDPDPNTSPPKKDPDPNTTPPKKDPDPNTPVPMVDDRVRQAHIKLKAGDLAGAIELLTQALDTKAKPNEPTKAYAELLKVWKEAQAKENFVPGGPTPFDFKPFQPPITAVVLVTDKDELEAYGRSKVAEKIKAAIPTLDDKTDWANLAAACEEAMKVPSDHAALPWVIACRAECWAELTKRKRTVEFSRPNLADPKSVTEGYIAYVTVLADSSAKELKPATIAAFAGNLKADKLPEWMTPSRSLSTASIFYDAATNGRTKGDEAFFQPYELATAAENYTYLKCGYAAHQNAGTAVPNEFVPTRADSVRETLFAGWSIEASKRPTAELKALLADWTELVPPATLSPVERLRGTLISASLQGDTAAEQKIALANYRDALAAFAKPNSDLPAAAVYRGVFVAMSKGRLASGLKGESEADRKSAAEVLSNAARTVRRDRVRYAGTPAAKVDGRSPIDLARDLFGQAFQLAPETPSNAAWRGICRSESADVDLAAMTADLAAASIAPYDRDPATLLLKGLVELRKVRPTPKVRPDLKALVGKDGSYIKAGESFVAAIDRAKSDPEPVKRYDELALAYKLASNSAIFLANLDKSDRLSQRERLANAVKYAQALNDLQGYSMLGLDSLGCALEDQAWLLRPEKWFAVDGPYTLSENAFKKAVDATKQTGSAEAYMHSGRTLVKWVQDRFHFRQRKNVPLETGRLTKAQGLLTAALNQAKKDPQPAVLAECYFWLAQIAEIRREAAEAEVNPAIDPEQYFTEAVKTYLLALAEADTPAAAEWYELTLIALLDVHYSEAVRQAKNGDRDAASTTVKALDDHATKLGRGVLPPVWLSRLEIYRIQINRAMNPDANPLEEIRKIVTAGTALSAATQDCWIQTELFKYLSVELYEKSTVPGLSEEKVAQHRKDALDAARKGWELAEKTQLMSIDHAVVAAGNYGDLAYNIGKWKEIEKKLFEDEWKVSIDPLTYAAFHGVHHAARWRWRGKLACSLIFRIDRDPYADLGKTANVSSLQFDQFREAIRDAAAERSVQSVPEQAFEDEIRKLMTQHSPNYQKFITAALKDSKNGTPEDRVIWRLAEGELKLLDDATPKMKKAIDEMRKDVADQVREMNDPQKKRTAEQSMRRIDKLLTSD